jgi:hypothetical protein
MSSEWKEQMAGHNKGSQDLKRAVVPQKQEKMMTKKKNTT